MCVFMCVFTAKSKHPPTNSHGFVFAMKTHVFRMCEKYDRNVCVFMRVFRAKTQNVGPARRIWDIPWIRGPEGGPLLASLEERERVFGRHTPTRVGGYIILCERVGVCPKTVGSGAARCVQFAFRPLNKAPGDTPKTHTRIEHVTLNLISGPGRKTLKSVCLCVASCLF